ncbi:N-acetylmuramoyl-L-alanine amidase [Romboutsia hominis]|uniref:N-acetylmuramoyl-L-alanine amidase n=1 Tax=Romboutsia hominis TaxID=1507512 RepID=UPI000A407E46|nr:N-acetylmuramoyl-L-alanine amidase [Romboutsia hominis]
MGTYNVHAGHDAQGRGASGASDKIDKIGWIYESIEDRKVKDEVIRLLKENNNTVYDCTVDAAGTQEKNLSQIVAKCNAHNVDLDVSIHFNSGRDDEEGDGDNAGVEVYCYDGGTKDIANRICNNISKLGFDNRGVKFKKDYYVLRNTKAPAILIECCFIDDKDDILLYKKVGHKAIAKAIVEGILNKNLDKKYTNCILYGNDIDRVGAEIISWTKEDCIIKNVKDHIAWEGSNLFTVGGPAKSELDKMNTKEKYTSIVGSDRYDTIRNCLKFVGR